MNLDGNKREKKSYVLMPFEGDYFLFQRGPVELQIVERFDRFEDIIYAFKGTSRKGLIAQMEFAGLSLLQQARLFSVFNDGAVLARTERGYQLILNGNQSEFNFDTYPNFVDSVRRNDALKAHVSNPNFRGYNLFPNEHAGLEGLLNILCSK